MDIPTFISFAFIQMISPVSTLSYLLLQIAWRIVRCRVDYFMALIMKGLNFNVPQYVRRDSVVVSHCMERKGRESDGVEKSIVRIRISSPHGIHCPMPMVQSAHLLLPSTLKTSEGDGHNGRQSIQFEMANQETDLQPQYGSIGPLTLVIPLSNLRVTPLDDSLLDQSRSQLSVLIRIDLCSWADSNRRSLTLTHQLNLNPPTSEMMLMTEKRDGNVASSSSAANVQGFGAEAWEWDTFQGKSISSSCQPSSSFKSEAAIDDHEDLEAGAIRNEGPFIEADPLLPAADQSSAASNRSSVRYSFISQVQKYDYDSVIDGLRDKAPSLDDNVGVQGGSGKDGDGPSQKKKRGGGRSLGRKKRGRESSEDEEDDLEEEEEWEED